MKLIKINKGNWLYPDEVEKIDSKTAIKKKDKTKVEMSDHLSLCLNLKKILLIQKQ